MGAGGASVCGICRVVSAAGGASSCGGSAAVSGAGSASSCGGSRWLYGRRRDVRPRFVCLFFCLPRGLWHLFRCLLQWRCGGRCSRSGLLGRCQILFHEARVVRRHEQRGDEDEEAELPIVVAREKGREDGEHHSDAAGEDARESERPALDEEAAGVREPTGEKEPKRHDASCHEKIRHAIAPFRYDDGGSRFPRAGDARRCAARYATFLTFDAEEDFPSWRDVFYEEISFMLVAAAPRRRRWRVPVQNRCVWRSSGGAAPGRGKQRHLLSFGLGGCGDVLFYWTNISYIRVFIQFFS